MPTAHAIADPATMAAAPSASLAELDADAIYARLAHVTTVGGAMLVGRGAALTPTARHLLEVDLPALLALVGQVEVG